MKNCVAVDKGALKMALNVLERAGKNEISQALRESCVELEELRAKAAAFDRLSKTGHLFRLNYDGRLFYGNHYIGGENSEQSLLEAVNNATGGKSER